MKIYHDFEQFQAPQTGVVLTIGNFDGVHRGHLRLLEAARARAGAALPVVVVTFEPHPLAVLFPERAAPRLTTLAERLELLGRAGAEAAVVLAANAQLLGLSAAAFLERAQHTFRPVAIVEGRRFNFGKDRGGSIETLRAHGAAHGYDVRVVETAQLGGDAALEISSSAIRRALSAGDVALAGAMLGRPHRVVGRVERGAQRGARLGFPTANVGTVAQMIPGHAVYAGAAQLADGALFLTAVNVGPQPTFDSGVARVEAHLLDVRRELTGQPLALYFLERLREQRRFAGPDALIQQLRLDVEQVRACAGKLKELAALPPLPVALGDGS